MSNPIPPISLLCSTPPPIDDETNNDNDDDFGSFEAAESEYEQYEASSLPITPEHKIHSIGDVVSTEDLPLPNDIDLPLYSNSCNNIDKEIAFTTNDKEKSTENEENLKSSQDTVSGHYLDSDTSILNINNEEALKLNDEIVNTLKPDEEKSLTLKYLEISNNGNTNKNLCNSSDSEELRTTNEEVCKTEVRLDQKTDESDDNGLIENRGIILVDGDSKNHVNCIQSSRGGSPNSLNLYTKNLSDFEEEVEPDPDPGNDNDSIEEYQSAIDVNRYDDNTSLPSLKFDAIGISKTTTPTSDEKLPTPTVCEEIVEKPNKEEHMVELSENDEFGEWTSENVDVNEFNSNCDGTDIIAKGNIIVDEDDEDFGDFSSGYKCEKISPDNLSVHREISEEIEEEIKHCAKNEISSFSKIDAEKTGNSSDVVSCNVYDTENPPFEADFSHFESFTGNLVENNSEQVMDIHRIVSSSSSSMESSTKEDIYKAKAAPVSLAEDRSEDFDDGEDDFDDFQDFTSANTIRAEKSDDEFGDFSNFKESTAKVAPLIPNNIDINDKLKPILMLMFPPAQAISPEEMCEDLKTDHRRLASNLKHVDSAKALDYQWSNSETKHSLIKSLGIDSRNILYGEKWNITMPRYAANLGFNPLEPLKPTKTYETQQKQNKSSPSCSSSSVFSSQQQEIKNNNSSDIIMSTTLPRTNGEIPAVEFDWNSAGLVNPLEASHAHTLLLDLDQLVVVANLDKIKLDSSSPLCCSPSLIVTTTSTITTTTTLSSTSSPCLPSSLGLSSSSPTLTSSTTTTVAPVTTANFSNFISPMISNFVLTHSSNLRSSMMGFKMNSTPSPDDFYKMNDNNEIFGNNSSLLTVKKFHLMKTNDYDVSNDDENYNVGNDLKNTFGNEFISHYDIIMGENYDIPTTTTTDFIDFADTLSKTNQLSSQNYNLGFYHFPNSYNEILPSENFTDCRSKETAHKGPLEKVHPSQFDLPNDVIQQSSTFLRNETTTSDVEKTTTPSDISKSIPNFNNDLNTVVEEPKLDTFEIIKSGESILSSSDHYVNSVSSMPINASDSEEIRPSNIPNTFMVPLKETHIFTLNASEGAISRSNIASVESDGKRDTIDFDYKIAAAGIIIDEKVIKKEYRDVVYDPDKLRSNSPLNLDSINSLENAQSIDLNRVVNLSNDFSLPETETENTGNSVHVSSGLAFSENFTVLGEKPSTMITDFSDQNTIPISSNPMNMFNNSKSDFDDFISPVSGKENVYNNRNMDNKNLTGSSTNDSIKALDTNSIDDEFTEFQSVPPTLNAMNINSNTNKLLKEEERIKSRTGTPTLTDEMILCPAVLLPKAIQIDNKEIHKQQQHQPKIEWPEPGINPEELARIEELFPQNSKHTNTTSSTATSLSPKKDKAENIPTISANTATADDDDWSDFVSVPAVNNTSSSNSVPFQLNQQNMFSTGPPSNQYNHSHHHHNHQTNTNSSSSFNEFNNDDEWSDFVSSAPTGQSVQQLPATNIWGNQNQFQNVFPPPIASNLGGNPSQQYQHHHQQQHQKHFNLASSNIHQTTITANNVPISKHIPIMNQGIYNQNNEKIGSSRMLSQYLLQPSDSQPPINHFLAPQNAIAAGSSHNNISGNTLLTNQQHHHQQYHLHQQQHVYNRNNRMMAAGSATNNNALKGQLNKKASNISLIPDLRYVAPKNSFVNAPKYNISKK